MIRRLRRRAASALDRRIDPLAARLDALDRRIDPLAAELEARLDALAEKLDGLAHSVQHAIDRTATVERASIWLVQGHAEKRARLRALRQRPEYTAVYAEREPLVSIVIPTYDRPGMLVERALASVLAQTYERLEVIVVGDAAPPAVAEAVAGVGDPRVRYVNLGYRRPHDDPTIGWLIGSVAARNAGHELARGAWRVDFDDDDALRPLAIERGLALALEERLEVAYGPYDCHWPDGSVERTRSFPPAFGRFATQGALMHAELERLFERTGAAGEFSYPNDWFRTETMLRAGVRFGMHDEVVLDYYPSMRGAGGSTRTPGSS